MRGWKACSVLVVLLLGGCVADATSLDEDTAPEGLQQQELSQVSAESEDIPPAVQQTTTGVVPLNPGSIAATTPGGKPQPDPWHHRTSTQGGPNKPQPDPWAPIEKTQTQQSK